VHTFPPKKTQWNVDVAKKYEFLVFNFCKWNKEEKKTNNDQNMRESQKKKDTKLGAQNM